MPTVTLGKDQDKVRAPLSVLTSMPASSPGLKGPDLRIKSARETG